MDEELKALNERLVSLDAVLSAHSVALATLIKTHPDPHRLRQQLSHAMDAAIQAQAADPQASGRLQAFEEAFHQLLRL